MPQNYNNKLSIYLIKREYTTYENIIKNVDILEMEQINNFQKLYYGGSQVFSPTWVKNFFEGNFSNIITNNGNGEDSLKIFSASAKAILFVETSERIFAITFGYGRSFLKPGVWEEGFGLKVLVNIIDPENVKSVDKKNMSITPKLVTEQATIKSSVSDFGIDIEQELLQGMTGKSLFSEFGQTVTGKDALSLSIKINSETVKEFLDLCYEKYNSVDYKKNFEWIDYIAEIKSPVIIGKLNDKLVEKIKNLEFEKIWMAIPSVVLWENISEFRLSNNQSSLGDDICINDFLESLDDPNVDHITLDTFKNENIECVSSSSNESIEEWKAFNCLCGEIELNDKVYILSNGKWYEVDENFASSVNNYFNSIRLVPPAIVLPDSIIGEHEDVYNERVASLISDMYCMDRKLIIHGGGKIEFCDLLTSDKKIIHVKRYGASSVLSHLFAQGLVSGDLFLSDLEFRNKVRNLLPDAYKTLISVTNPDPTEYTIVFAIVSKSGNLINIPFFSKVNLRNTIKRLNGSFRYNVSFVSVKTN